MSEGQYWTTPASVTSQAKTQKVVNQIPALSNLIKSIGPISSYVWTFDGPINSLKYESRPILATPAVVGP